VPVVSRRRQIEDAASALFGSRGYAAASMRDIAKLVDLQGGSLYAHVSSKEDVLWSIVEGAAARFHAEVGPIARGGGTVPARLRAMARAHVRVITDDRDRAGVFLFQWTALGPERRAEIAKLRDDYEGYWRELIGAGVASGELRATDPKLAATLVLSALNGTALWYRPEGRFGAEEIADRYADLLLGGLLERPSPGSSARPAGNLDGRLLARDRGRASQEPAHHDPAYSTRPGHGRPGHGAGKESR
jgi:AcrR family transcriptional regulator